MPLRETLYGKECPLNKFMVEVTSGSYSDDPVKLCLNCNFADISSKESDLEKICQCPDGMNWTEYDRLRKSYSSTGGNLTREGFLEFVKETYTNRQRITPSS